MGKPVHRCDVSDRFEICLAETLKWEGGWSNHPRDPGGPTMRGIIQRVYDGWRDNHRLPRRSVRAIEDHELRDIYRRSYWDQVRGDELPAGIDLAVFDFAVNSGPARAAKYLQRVLGVKVDGHIGPATLGAAASADSQAVVEQLMDDRRTYIRQIRTYDAFGRGWERRCDGIEDAAIAMLDAPLAGAAIDDWETTVIPAPGKAVETQAPDVSWTPGETAGAYVSGGSGVQLGVDVAASAQKVAAKGAFSIVDLALELATRPSFWVAAFVLTSSIWMWLAARRRRWLLE
jgi:lysozyme family protein